MPSILFAALIVMTTSLIGVIFITDKLGNWLNNNIKLLASLAAGTFAFLVYNLATESVDLLGAQTALLIILGSFIISWLGFKLIPFFHHHHTDLETHNHSLQEGRKILVADGIHNIGDGVVLVAAFTVSSPLGWTTALGIFLHEFIQEISEYFVLRRSGYSNKKALLLNFGVSSTIFIGIMLAITASQFAIHGYLLATTAGVFLSVVLQDLLPDTIKSAKQPGNLAPYLIAFLIGALSLYGLSTTMGHGHGTEHNDQEVR